MWDTGACLSVKVQFGQAAAEPAPAQEADFSWLNHVYQLASSPEAAGSGRTRLDGLGKRSPSSAGWCQDKIQTRAGGVISELWEGTSCCGKASDPQRPWWIPAQRSCWGAFYHPGHTCRSRDSQMRLLSTSADGWERSLRNLTWRWTGPAGVTQPVLVPVRPLRFDVLKA